jgi:hypothetical protein
MGKNIGNIETILKFHVSKSEVIHCKNSANSTKHCVGTT